MRVGAVVNAQLALSEVERKLLECVRNLPPNELLWLLDQLKIVEAELNRKDPRRTTINDLIRYLEDL